MIIELSTDAQDDLVAGYQFYAEQLEFVGEYFLDSLYADIDSLLLYAGIHPIVDGFYRMLSNRFPFAIYYKITEERILVYRILDCRQNPERIYRKLRKK